MRKEEARSWEIGVIARHPDMGTLEDKVAPDPDNRRPLRRIHARFLTMRQSPHGATVTRKSYADRLVRRPPHQVRPGGEMSAPCHPVAQQECQR